STHTPRYSYLHMSPAATLSPVNRPPPSSPHTLSLHDALPILHAQVVAVRSIGKEYPLAVRAELGVHRAKIFFQFPLGARCQVQNESAQFFDSRSARSHKGGVPPVGRDIGDYTVCDPRFVATQSWNP